MVSPPWFTRPVLHGAVLTNAPYAGCEELYESGGDGTRSLLAALPRGA